MAWHDVRGQAWGCSAYGGRRRQIGQDVSEQLGYVPARFKVLRHIRRPKLGCMACASIFQPPAPSSPITRGVAGPSLLAHVLVAKYCDHHRDDRASVSADAPAVWFRYSSDRKGEHPQAHRKDFKGVLQADAYAGFAKLYAMEADIRGRPPADRCRERQARAGPLLEELFTCSSFRKPARTATKLARVRSFILGREDMAAISHRSVAGLEVGLGCQPAQRVARGN
ncbi:transposase [Variovorax sp. J31P216]|uniref:IS66 family transposase n=1 Tax=Variovorax saccharolyticus TaxID=3053516 RepID=UPI002578AF1B|nr:transposase [Variovorax sp. J31P216]MDM0030440.1 transposase [Variovorax sp. J31P216]